MCGRLQNVDDMCMVRKVAEVLRKVAEGCGRLQKCCGRLQKVAEGCKRLTASRYPNRTPWGSLRGIVVERAHWIYFHFELSRASVNGVPSHIATCATYK